MHRIGPSAKHEKMKKHKNVEEATNEFNEINCIFFCYVKTVCTSNESNFSFHYHCPHRNQQQKIDSAQKNRRRKMLEHSQFSFTSSFLFPSHLIIEGILDLTLLTYTFRKHSTGTNYFDHQSWWNTNEM